MNTLIASVAASLGVFAVSAGAASATTLTTPKPHFQSSIEQVQYWSGRSRGCRAIGVTINGRAIPGVSGRGFGRDACSEALHECRFELRQRQRLGANPFGRCIVVR